MKNKTNTEITESTAVKTAPELKDKKRLSPLWQSVLVGGVPGIMIGVGGTIGVEAIADSKLDDIEEGSIPEDQETVVPTEMVEIHEAHSVTDDMSFNEAFAAARAEVGPGGAFVWHGHVYGTYRSSDPEWQEMTDADRAAHSQNIMSQVHAAPYTPTENEPEIVPAPENNEQAEDAPVDNAVEEVDDEIDVHILGVGEVEGPDGSVAQVGVGTVDDHAAVFADTDGDDIVDTVLIDTTDNSYVDRDEIFDASDAGITMDDLRDAVEPAFTEVVDDTPDVYDAPDGSLFI